MPPQDLSTTPSRPTQTPLSPTQSFLCMFDQGDGTGPLGPRYNIVVGWRVRGPLDTDVLRAALGDVAARHDVLRNEIVIISEATRWQQIHPPAPARLEIVDLVGDDRDVRAERLLGEVEAGSYPREERPHLRAVLGRFDDDDAVLALVVHHTAGDGWSMQLLIRDLAECYAARRGLRPPLDLRSTGHCSYRDYAQARQADSAAAVLGGATTYWRDKLAGARILPVPTDHPRSAGLDKVSPVHRFVIPAEVAGRVAAMAKVLRSSPFMVLFAAYNVLMRQITGADDLVIPTLSSGRTQLEYERTVGPFFNFVPLRTDLSGAADFRDVVERTRNTCIEAMTQEIPFLQLLPEAPDLMTSMSGDRAAACAFQVWQFSSVLDHEPIGDLEYSEIRRRLLPQASGTDIPDGALLTLDLDPAGEIYGNIAYNSNLYREQTIRTMADGYCRILAAAMAHPDAPTQTL